MAGVVRTRIEGARELDQVLRKLPKEIGKRVLGAAARKGANVIAKEARQNLGGDKKDIIVRKVRVAGTSLTMRIGISRKKFFLMFREFGTRPHKIAAKTGGSGRLLADPDTGAVFGPEIAHPGQTPRPFLRPAFDTKKREALAVMGKTLAVGIEKAAVKLAGSFAKSGLKRSRRRRRR